MWLHAIACRLQAKTLVKVLVERGAKNGVKEEGSGEGVDAGSDFARSGVARL